VKGEAPIPLLERMRSEVASVAAIKRSRGRHRGVHSVSGSRHFELRSDALLASAPSRSPWARTGRSVPGAKLAEVSAAS